MTERSEATSPRPGPVLCVVGARPNFMKMAPILDAFRRATPAVPALLVHTGQHYDTVMSDQQFEALGLPRPDIALDVGSASHAVQTAEIMRRFEPVLTDTAPSAVLVVGDVNSTIACALVAAKCGVPVAHVEAGLRSFDRSMPEEINRVLTDQLAELLFTTEEGAADNLAREGIAAERVHFVGNVMIDSVLRSLPRAVPAGETLAAPFPSPLPCSGERARVRGTHDHSPPRGAPSSQPSPPVGEKGLDSRFALVTLHRPSNVDDPATLRRLLDVLAEIAAALPVVFPVHPRTRARIEAAGLQAQLERPGMHALPPLDYLAMLGLMRDASCVLTDSGGIQEETTALGVPCLTLRPNTERPITVEQGTNTIVGTDRRAILDAVAEVVRDGGKRGRVPARWDGHAAERIAAVMADWLAGRARRVA